jgi:hypothetical protein
VGAAFCATLTDRASTFSRDQVTQAAPTDPALAAFITDYRNQAASISFDRTFVFISIVALLGFIPAWFLRRPEKPAADGGFAAA